jgi:hypothetical protein
MTDESSNRILHGDRFITLQDIKTTGATAWAAPCTGSFECVIPEGTILVAKYDQVKGAMGFSCAPENYKEFERKFVPASDRNELKYGGYYFSFLNADIGQKIKLISHAASKERKKYELKMRVQGWFKDIIVLQLLMILAMYMVLIIVLPFKPLIDMYRKKKIDARRKAEEQRSKD